MRVLCPAKVNLFLAVGPVDSRGYHPLRTLFQAVGLYDELHVERSLTGSHKITSNWPGMPEENTVSKALRMLAEIAMVPPLRIHIEKRIPAESGLGGGSSDAAGLIRAIHRFIPAKIAATHLHDVAVAVGADVPFFLVGGMARGEGYGELLTPLPDREREWFVIVRPEEGCSTKDAFLRLDANPYPWREFPETDELYNDFERVMPCASDDWQERLLTHGARDVLLCGSGSAIFGRFRSEMEAERAAERLRDERVPHAWVVPTLTRAESLAILTPPV